MRVVYSARAQAEFETYFADGITRFGLRVAEDTFRRIRQTLNQVLAAHPFLGQFLAARQVYRCLIPRTPFVAYYHVDVDTDEITILAMFHGARDRTEFETG